ncbi:hypothetical protein [Luteibacter sp. SG786]|uniref:hypothetical protein n=1 Tax=Luteibacter sp. SG786 TaxID=2587130 RepID=UPI00141E8994|nr:hypothetical protein [Luteibacter sp. SG786]NII54940.1 hypothetical protein [Luteibacter sp. SG786]
MSKVGKTARRKLFAPIFDPRTARRRTPPATLRSPASGPLVDLTGELTFAPADLAKPPPAPLPPDNLLLAVANGREIMVRIPLPPPEELGGVRVRDTVMLEIDGVELLSTAKELVAADITNGYKEIPLPDADRGGEGRHSIRYAILLTSGDGSRHPGPNQPYVIDLTRPGDPSLADLEFPGAPDGFVTLDSIIDDGTNEPYLLATVDGYAGLAPGDEIIGYIDGNEETLHSTNDGNGLNIHFTQAFIESQGDGDKEFSYEVEDRAGNRSIRSRGKLLKVLVKDAIRNLAPPSVPSYDDDADPKVIDEDDARAIGGLQVIIPANPGILPGDDIIVMWGDADVGPTAVPDPTVVTPVSVRYAAILDAWVEGGNEDDTPVPVTVHYRVERGGIVAGRTATGADVEVNLYQAGGADPDPETPENENLGAPALQSGDANDPPNTISLTGFELDATVTIPWETVDASGTLLLDDVIDVQYDASGTIGPRIVDQDDVDAAVPIALTLPTATIQAAGSGSKALRYTVTRQLQQNGPNVARSPTQAVEVVGADGLPGGGTLAPIRVPVAAGLDPIDPDRLILAPRHAPAPTDTVDFVIPHYANQDTADTVVINVVAYDLFGYEVHTPPGLPEDPMPDRDMLNIPVTIVSTVADTVVPINGYDLLGFNPDPDDQSKWTAIHAHVTYKVTNTAGTVESTDQVLDIDGRAGPVNP